MPYPADAPKIQRKIENRWKVIFQPAKIIPVGRLTGIINFVFVDTREQARDIAHELKLEGRRTEICRYID